VRRFVPILEWLPRYDRRWLRGDVAAGIAVTALIVPKNLGYAGIAGVPLENGLYAAAAGALIYALFCTSRQISTGPSSSLAAVAGGAVLATGLAGDQAAQLVAAITLVTGVLYLLLALLKLGWIAQFLSKAVVTGFLAGAAIDVTVGELPKLTGTSGDGDNVWQEFGSWLRGLGDIHGATLLVGVVALTVILALRFLAPAVPGALVLVVGGLLASAVFDLGARGVTLVGDVPRGLPVPMLPDLEVFQQNLSVIGIASAALLLIGFSQTAGDARAFATRHHYRVDVDQESIAQGMANVGAGVFQGMPVSTSLSASSLNESSGARTPLASVVTGALVIATLIFLAPLFSDLPKAVLAAVIIDAVVFGMIDIPEFRRLYRVTRFDFWIAMVAFLGVLSAGVLFGVLIGIVLSLGWLIYVATQPSMPLLGREPDTQVFRDIDENPEDETFEGIVVLRLDGGLFFATAEALENRIRDLVHERARHGGGQLRRLPGCREARRAVRVPSRGRHRLPGRTRETPRPCRASRRRSRRPDRDGPHPRQRPPRRPGSVDAHPVRGAGELKPDGSRAACWAGDMPCSGRFAAADRSGVRARRRRRRRSRSSRSGKTCRKLAVSLPGG
jgi:sulfate permease, SulP family